MLLQKLTGALESIPRLQIVALYTQAHATRHERLRQGLPVALLLQQRNRFRDQREGGVELVQIVQHAPFPEH